MWTGLIFQEEPLTEGLVRLKACMCRVRDGGLGNPQSKGHLLPFHTAGMRDSHSESAPSWSSVKLRHSKNASHTGWENKVLSLSTLGRKDVQRLHLPCPP